MISCNSLEILFNIFHMDYSSCYDFVIFLQFDRTKAMWLSFAFYRELCKKYVYSSDPSNNVHIANDINQY